MSIGITDFFRTFVACSESNKMTAIVGVLNKRAIAIAADSAVTMGNTHKVINSANKIFTLSKYHPVAVMTYNNATFMNTPWEIIIKEYRRELKDKCFPALQDYVNDFLDFLHRRNFFCGERMQFAQQYNMLRSFYDICCKEYRDKHHIRKDEALTQDMIEEKLSECIERNKSAERCPDFKGYALKDFKRDTKKAIQKFAEETGLKNVNLLTEAYFYYIAVMTLTYSYTGLVFVGYGEDEIYPSLIPTNISSFVVNGHLKYFIEQNRIAHISEEGPEAAICPFAQTDVIQTIMNGIHPSFLAIIGGVTENAMHSLIEIINSEIRKNPDNASMADALEHLNLGPIIKKTTNDMALEIRKFYTDPLLDTVVVLDKDDMANMAGSFISLTSLVRRMQPGEETVGGPVDVAVISKGDGFIWIKRKHYFKPELNPSFFSNYFIK